MSGKAQMSEEIQFKARRPEGSGGNSTEQSIVGWRNGMLKGLKVVKFETLEELKCERVGSLWCHVKLIGQWPHLHTFVEALTKGHDLLDWGWHWNSVEPASKPHFVSQHRPLIDGWIAFLLRCIPCFLLTDVLHTLGFLYNRVKFMVSLSELYFYSLSMRLVISTKSDIVVWFVCFMISPLDLGRLMFPSSRSLEILLDALPAIM